MSFGCGRFPFFLGGWFHFFKSDASTPWAAAILSQVSPFLISYSIFSRGGGGRTALIFRVLPARK